LFAYIAIRHYGDIRFCDLQEISEYPVVFHLEVFYPGSKPLSFLQFVKPSTAFFFDFEQFVKPLMVACLD
jgi:hypothetical protein